MIVSHFVSLRSRLFVVVALAIAPFLLYATLIAIRTSADVSPVVQSATVAQAQASARHVDAQLLLVDQLLDSAMTQARKPGRQLRAPEISDSLNRALASSLTIALLDASGRRTGLVIGDGARVDGIPLARRTIAVGTAIGSARRQSTAATTAAATFVDEGETRTDTDSIALIIVRPITRSATRCDCLADAPGAVMAVLSDRTVLHLIGGDTLPSGSVAVMTGSVGGLLGRPLLPGGWSDRDARDSAVLATSVQRDGIVQLRGDDGVRRMFGFAALARLPWRVYVGAPVAAAAPAPAHLLRDLSILSLLAAAIAVLGIVLATRASTRPLQRLLADTHYLTSGAISHRTDVARRSDDLGALGGMINSLASEIESLRRRIDTDARRVDVRPTRAATAASPAAPTVPLRPMPVPMPVAAPRAVAPAAQLSAAIDHADQIAFAGQMADDLNTIMQGIAGFTQLALDSADDPDMRNIAVERIRDLATTGLAMARQMQAYGERDLLGLEIIDANETLTAAVESMAETLGGDVELNTLYNVAPAVVRADPRLLSQAVTALIANARDAMPAGGTLTVATTFVEVPVHAREPYAAPPGEYIVVTIADTGMGMSPDSQRRMFEPFWSTKAHTGTGVGLGLAAVAGIAREHGWTISVETELRVGTAVSLYMPVSAAALAAPTDGDAHSTRETEPARSV